MHVGFEREQRAGFDCRSAARDINVRQILHKVSAVWVAHAARNRATSQWQNSSVQVPSQGNVRPAEKRLPHRSEEHTSELQSLMRISYAVFCLKKKKKKQQTKANKNN